MACWFTVTGWGSTALRGPRFSRSPIRGATFTSRYDLERYAVCWWLRNQTALVVPLYRNNKDKFTLILYCSGCSERGGASTTLYDAVDVFVPTVRLENQYNCRVRMQGLNWARAQQVGAPHPDIQMVLSQSSASNLPASHHWQLSPFCLSNFSYTKQMYLL